jgi:hypothetical protein
MNNQQTSTTTAENENILENENLSTNNNVHNQPVVNIIEVSNIYPINLVKHNLHASQRPTISIIRREAYDTCRGKLPQEYIHWAFNKFKNGYYYTIDNKLAAFCIWKILDPIMDITTLKINTPIYIYLICGKKLDYQLVPRICDDIVHYCRKSNIQHIILQPANSELKPYYITKGFHEGKYLANNNILQLDVSMSRISYPETRTAPGQTRRRIRSMR